jgi:hypothetical protein
VPMFAGMLPMIALFGRRLAGHRSTRALHLVLQGDRAEPKGLPHLLLPFQGGRLRVTAGRLLAGRPGSVIGAGHAYDITVRSYSARRRLPLAVVRAGRNRGAWVSRRLRRGDRPQSIGLIKLHG